MDKEVYSRTRLHIINKNHMAGFEYFSDGSKRKVEYIREGSGEKPVDVWGWFKVARALERGEK